MFLLRKYLITIIAVIAILLNFSLLFILLSKTGKLEKRITMSSTAESSFNETVKTTLIKTSDEINILREILSLPAAAFPSFEENNEKSNANSNRAYGYEIYYTAFEKLYSQHTKNEAIGKLNKFISEINPILTKHKFLKDQKDALLYLLLENNIYYSLTYNIEKEKFAASFFPFENKTDIVSADDFQSFVDNTYPKVKSVYAKALSEISLLKNYINSEDVKKSFSEKKIKTLPVTENKDIYNTRLFTISRINNQPVGTISYSYKKEGFIINEKFYGDYEKSKNIILNIDDYIDIRLIEEKIVEQSVKDIKRMADDPSFKMFLESKGYYLSVNPREDSEHFFFDFLPSGGGKYIGSFAINKYTGEIYLTDFEEIQLSSVKSLKTINPDNQNLKKKI